MKQKLKLIIVFVMALLAVNIAYGASCSVGSVSSINTVSPANNAIYTLGTYVDSTWDGSTLWLGATATFDPYADTRCTHVYQAIIFDDGADIYQTEDNTVSLNLNVIGNGTLGTYTWWGKSAPVGTGCPYSYCTTPHWSYTIKGSPGPVPPHIDSSDPADGQTFVSGTSSVSLSCGGSCPDPLGCTMNFIGDDDVQINSQSFATCTGINCRTKTYTWSSLTAGWHDWNCELVEKGSLGRYDDIPYGPVEFKINGTACPVITSNFPSPTPIYSSTVNNLSNYIQLSIKTDISSNVDITYYTCSDTANTCSPNILVSQVNVDLNNAFQTLPKVLVEANPGDKYVRWYAIYSFNSPGSCADVKRSNNGINTAYFKLNQTVLSLNVTLGSPANNTQIPLSAVPIDFIFNTQAVVPYGTNITDTLYIDGILIDSESKLPGFSTFPGINVGTGHHSWYVVVNDGFSTKQSLSFNFDVISGPTITLKGPGTSPACYYYPYGSTSTFSSPITWEVSSNGVHTDLLIVNGVVTQNFSATSNFRSMANMAIQGGLPYNWQINSTDSNGQSVLSSSWCFQVNCSTIWSKQDVSCGMDNRRIIEYIDVNNCVYPTISVPVDNGTYEPCAYCGDAWSCSSYEDCQMNNTQRCLNVTNIGMIKCANATPTVSDLRGNDRSCSYVTGVDTIDFSSNELVDLNDPFNKGILPDIWNGIVALISTPFYYWLLLIVAALTLFLSAVALLYWVRNMR